MSLDARTSCFRSSTKSDHSGGGGSSELNTTMKSKCAPCREWGGQRSWQRWRADGLGRGFEMGGLLVSDETWPVTRSGH